MERQEQDVDPPWWLRGLARTFFFGGLNVALGAVSGGQIGFPPKTKIKEPVSTPTKPLPMSPTRPVEDAYKEPDLLDQIYMSYGILRPLRH
jgi:hypothetical protein